ncbi:hypothetical protein LV779_26390 [Streptomyces thinghirensis]|nr:hypothetical protein [Streptomyces thinghirensis]
MSDDGAGPGPADDVGVTTGALARRLGVSPDDDQIVGPALRAGSGRPGKAAGTGAGGRRTSRCWRRCAG